ncbi:PREDICTED: testis-expressed sequence 2 protein-like, partial [Apaloderma vittatum]|uniref:testis-expressed sequence 2 protein-like n=1 Tax=Apaloderma vittatum TaxID=57397 RepID=UPI00052149A2
GWMNQLQVYDPELFHPSLTHSVLATLDGATLKLSYPKSNIPRRVSPAVPGTFSLTPPHPGPASSLLSVLQVFLCPSSLARKRTWNKKYPICVLLPEPAAVEGRSSEEQDTEPQGDEGTKKALSSGSSSGESTEDIPSAIPPKDPAESDQQEIFLDYSTYMARFVPAQVGGSPDPSPSHGALGSPTPLKTCMAWMNALVGRIFWDFLREQYWAEQVSNKIQKKLSKIKLPYFMNELTLTELDMGTSIPSVLSASSPTVNDRGLWVDMEVTYSGSLQMTLETKMNLCKLGKESAAEESGLAEAGRDRRTTSRLILLADSDAESSSAGSSDEEDIVTAEPAGALGERVPPPGTEGHVGGNSTSRKILRFVDKIAKSKYFQKATENEFIKKKFEEVSNTPLLLTVEVQELAGTLAVNIPPPPTDRVWYSFRVPPQLELKVRPKLGEREVTFLHVTEWIEKKLQHEFQKILVMPNMDDLIIPIMSSGLDPQPLTVGLPRDLPAKAEKRL